MSWWLVLPTLLTVYAVGLVVVNTMREHDILKTLNYKPTRLYVDAFFSALIASFFTIGLPALSVWLALTFDH